MKIKKFISLVFIFLFLYVVSSCGSARTHVGLDMRFGPNGPYVSPSVGVDFYGGGRH